MSFDGWIEFGGVELINLSRTAQLASLMGVTQVWTDPASVEWIEDALSGVGYSDVTEAPWYDPSYPASGEFAGIVPLSFPGLGDSTLTSTITEYITDGGNTGRPRNATLNIVASVGIVAATDRGAEFGKRWMDTVLAGPGPTATCSGTKLRYFRFADETSPIAHHRNVRTTRGSSVTRKTRNDCSVTWLATFTLTAGDPFEYGEPVASIVELGDSVSGPGLVSSGSIVLVQSGCPEYDYSPVYAPEFPALVASPTAPDIFPAGWDIVDGATFQRFWAIVAPVEPANLPVVPVITLFTPADARIVRVSIWTPDSLITNQCSPLFSAVVTYVPANINFIIDGEQKVSYVWDGVSPAVRRTDSLVYSPDARPVDWASFNTEGGLLVTLDLFTESGIYDGPVDMALSLVPKSN